MDPRNLLWLGCLLVISATQAASTEKDGTLADALKRIAALEVKAKFIDDLVANRTWTALDGKSFFVDENVKLSFDEATKYCKERKGNLAEVPGTTSENLALWLDNLRKENDRYWNALRSQGKGAFVWQQSGKEVGATDAYWTDDKSTVRGASSVCASFWSDERRGIWKWVAEDCDKAEARVLCQYPIPIRST